MYLLFTYLCSVKSLFSNIVLNLFLWNHQPPRTHHPHTSCFCPVLISLNSHLSQPQFTFIFDVWDSPIYLQIPPQRRGYCDGDFTLYTHLHTHIYLYIRIHIQLHFQIYKHLVSSLSIRFFLLILYYKHSLKCLHFLLDHLFDSLSYLLFYRKFIA